MALNPPVSTNIITSGWETNEDGTHYGISYPFVFLNSEENDSEEFYSKENTVIKLTHEIMEFNHNGNIACERSLAIVDSVKEV